MSNVVVTGRLAMGSKHIEMGEALRRAKQDFARGIVEQLQPYFNLVGIPLSTVKAIIVSGGGSMASTYISNEGKQITMCGPASEFITKELTEVVDGVEVISTPDEPRTANIRGMLIMAMMEIKMRQKTNVTQ